MSAAIICEKKNNEMNQKYGFENAIEALNFIFFVYFFIFISYFNLILIFIMKIKLNFFLYIIKNLNMVVVQIWCIYIKFYYDDENKDHYN